MKQLLGWEPQLGTKVDSQGLFVLCRCRHTLSMYVNTVTISLTVLSSSLYNWYGLATFFVHHRDCLGVVHFKFHWYVFLTLPALSVLCVVLSWSTTTALVYRFAHWNEVGILFQCMRT